MEKLQRNWLIGWKCLLVAIEFLYRLRLLPEIITMTNDKSQTLTNLEQQLREGDVTALARLFDHYRDRLHRIIEFRLDKRLHVRIDPQDVLQEAYLAASQRVPYFQRQAAMSVFVWLRLLVLQTVTDLYRRHLATGKRDIGKELVLPYPSPSMSIASGFFGHISSPSLMYANLDLFDKVERAIATMSKSDQEIIAMRHFEELNNKEVAEILGVEQKAASIRYYRALAKLRTVLSEYSAFLEISNL
jgi:RNA polymerase sigma-70 factor, ECF subfamily